MNTRSHSRSAPSPTTKQPVNHNTPKSASDSHYRSTTSFQPPAEVRASENPFKQSQFSRFQHPSTTQPVKPLSYNSKVQTSLNTASSTILKEQPKTSPNYVNIKAKRSLEDTSLIPENFISKKQKNKTLDLSEEVDPNDQTKQVIDVNEDDFINTQQAIGLYPETPMDVDMNELDSNLERLNDEYVNLEQAYNNLGQQMASSLSELRTSWMRENKVLDDMRKEMISMSIKIEEIQSQKAVEYQTKKDLWKQLITKLNQRQNESGFKLQSEKLRQSIVKLKNKK